MEASAYNLKPKRWSKPCRILSEYDGKEAAYIFVVSVVHIRRSVTIVPMVGEAAYRFRDGEKRRWIEILNLYQWGNHKCVGDGDEVLKPFRCERRLHMRKWIGAFNTPRWRVRLRRGRGESVGGWPEYIYDGVKFRSDGFRSTYKGDLAARSGRERRRQWKRDDRRWPRHVLRRRDGRPRVTEPVKRFPMVETRRWWRGLSRRTEHIHG